MMHKFEYEYRQYVVPYAPPQGSPFRIIVPDYKVKMVERLARDTAIAKTVEDHHQEDNQSEYTRYYTGFIGEAAMEEFLGIDILDYSVGNSNDYNHADLRKHGLNIGVKTVEPWKFHIVHKNPVRPELICVKRKPNEVLLFGYATVDVLRRYQTEEFILAKGLKARGTKAAFYGYSELIPIHTLDELKKVYRKYDRG